MQIDEKHIIEQLSRHPVDAKAEAAATALLSPADYSGFFSAYGPRQVQEAKARALQPHLAGLLSLVAQSNRRRRR